MKRMKIVFYTLLILLSVFYLSQAFEFGLWQGYGPGPGLLPVILGFTMLILSIFQLFSHDGLKSQDKEIFLTKEEAKRLAILLVVNIVAIVLLESVGFIVVITAFAFVILFFMDKWTFTKSITLSLGLSIVCWILFAVVFKLPLPEGILTFLS